MKWHEMPHFGSLWLSKWVEPRYDALNEQIRVMAMGLCRPKGQGKGPPLPCKGKGKGKGSKGLGALAQDLQPQIGRSEGLLKEVKSRRLKGS